jgi:hypothetical protein
MSREASPRACAADLVQRHAHILILAIGLVAIVFFRLYTGIVLEDALITFRIAENAVQGQGLVYNLGERVQGSTTPLFTLLLAAGGALLGVARIPLLAVCIAIPATLIAAWLIHRTLLILSVPSPVALATLLLFLLRPETLWSTSGGMETPLVVLAMAASWYFLARDQAFWAAISCGLLILLRIDGAVWTALVILWLLLRGWRRGVWCGAVVLLTIAPWFIFAAVYFGQPLPQSVLAKGVIGEAYHLLDWHEFVSRTKWHAPYVGALSHYTFSIGLPIYFVGMASIFRSGRREFLLPALFPVLFFFALHVGHAPRFPWYMVPATWCALVTAVVGWWHIGRTVHARVSGPLASKLSAAGVVLFVLVIAGFLRRDMREAQWQRDYQINENGLRKAVGLWLHDHLQPASSVATESIGYQGYYSQCRTIDLAGLVSPGVVEIRRASSSNAEAFRITLKRLKPDAIVLRSFEVDENRHFHGGKLFENPEQRKEFGDTYREVARFHAPLEAFWGPLGHLTVFRRI